MKNKAFTLAETLIVTSIIGVIATIMLNSMSKLAPDKEKMLYKKAYQTVEKTVGELVNDESLYPYDLNKLGFINTAAAKLPGENTSYSGATKFRSLFAEKLNIPGRVTSSSDSATFRTSDGIQYTINNWTPTSSGTNSTTTISIDINGPKQPNTSNNVHNRDRYTVIVGYDGSVEPGGDKEREFLKSTDPKKNVAK